VAQKEGGAVVTLIYDGVLTRSEIDYCRSAADKYPYVVEMSRYPVHAWLEANLKHREWWQNCDTPVGDQTVKRNSILYAMVQRNFSEDRDERGNFIGGGFLFLKDEADWRAVVDRLPDLVKNAKPFRTALA
jgi:hypothetical protein